MPSAIVSDAADPATDTRYYILGTAGHIDHGKTSLVKALTGTDTDRLPEERRRGMTIELGFAELTMGDARFGIVDVPGHERFVRTMVAGASGIDLALLVVAADDSVMPQTVEHVEILHLLGVPRAVVAVTKIDAVEPDMVPLVADDVRHLLAGTPLADAVVCPVSSHTGEGIDALKQALRLAAASVQRESADMPFRMAVDRVFTVQGRGTVVTGSAVQGRLTSGETLEVWPLGETCRVRDLQSHGQSSDLLQRGQRCAINVSGIDREQLQRGAVLATPGYLNPSRLLDVRLQYLSSNDRALKSASVARLELGTTEVPVRVVLLDKRALEPGESDYAQLRSGEWITAVYGQRFILRDQNASRTIGGGVVLRPAARRRRRDAADERTLLEALDGGSAADRLADVLHQASFQRPTDLQLSARAGVAPADLPGLFAELAAAKRWIQIPGSEVHATPQAVEDLYLRLTNWLRRYHQKNPNAPGRLAESVLGWLERMSGRAAARPLLEHWIERQRLKRLGRFVCLPEFAPRLSTADEKTLHAMIEEIRGGGFSPPLLDELSFATPADRKRIDRLATLAAALGELVLIDGRLYLHADVERRLRETVASLIDTEGGVTVARVREALGSSRKFVVPILEYLDRVGFTRRQGDLRHLVDAVAGDAGPPPRNPS